jgi:tetratricopeptide (TPR) repeat protein
MTRPNPPGGIGGIGGGNRPGDGVRPGRPGGDLVRPTPLPGRPGGIGGIRPGRPGGGLSPGDLTRPTPLPGRPGGIGDGNRPGRPGGGFRPGDLTRPTPLPGRPGGPGGIGGGNRPGGGVRPGRPGGDLVRPTPLPGRPGGIGGEWWANRPGWGDGGQQWPWPNRPGRPGGGNIGQIGDNLGIVNRPNFGNNTIITNNNWNTVNNNWFGGTNIYSSNYFGGNAGWGWNANPYSAFHQDWYHGSWGGNYLGGWFGPAFGVGNVGIGPWIDGGFVPTGGFVSGVYQTFPSWGVSNLVGWGLNTLASTWINSAFSNPYYSAPTTVIYDYSRPIDVTAPPPEPSTAEAALTTFEAARDSFKAGDYDRALALVDQAIQQQPNDPTMHEFRALALFALKRYDEAAAVAYSVLAAGPGWNWTTLISLYPDSDAYTNQLRALEAQVRSNPQATPTQFLLAYHYLVQGNADAARARFARVAELQPSDQLSARFVEALTKPEPAATTPAPAAAATATETTTPAAEPEPTPPSPPPSNLSGTWKAQAGPDTNITLELKEGGAFTWQVATQGRTETLEGQAAFRDDVLMLNQTQGPPLAGKVHTEESKPDAFTFQLLGGDKAPALAFQR